MRSVSVAALRTPCSDEDVVQFAVQHYFSTEELAEAQRMMETGKSYEEAIAYLAEQSQNTLRLSDDHQPHMLITIPGGTVSIWHPQRRFPDCRPVLKCQVGHLASRALARPSMEERPSTIARSTSTPRYHTFSLFDDVPDEIPEKQDEKTKRTNTRPKKLKYVEQPVRMGTKKVWHTRPGWVVKDGHLGYVVEVKKPDFVEVSLVHLVSHHVMASVFLSSLNETTHARIQSWVADVYPLTDWSKGIASVLKEKTGGKQKTAWSRQLEEMWRTHRDKHYQLSLFDMSE